MFLITPTKSRNLSEYSDRAPPFETLASHFGEHRNYQPTSNKARRLLLLSDKKGTQPHADHHGALEQPQPLHSISSVSQKTFVSGKRKNFISPLRKFLRCRDKATRITCLVRHILVKPCADSESRFCCLRLFQGWRQHDQQSPDVQMGLDRFDENLGLSICLLHQCQHAHTARSIALRYIPPRSPDRGSGAGCGKNSVAVTWKTFPAKSHRLARSRIVPVCALCCVHRKHREWLGKSRATTLKAACRQFVLKKGAAS